MCIKFLDSELSTCLISYCTAMHLKVHKYVATTAEQFSPTNSYIKY